MKVLILVAAACLYMANAQDLPEIDPPLCSFGGGSATSHRMWAEQQEKAEPYHGKAGESYLCTVEFTPAVACSAQTQFMMTARPLNLKKLEPPHFAQKINIGACSAGATMNATIDFNIPKGIGKKEVLYTAEVYDPASDEVILCLQGQGDIA